MLLSTWSGAGRVNRCRPGRVGSDPKAAERCWSGGRAVGHPPRRAGQRAAHSGQTRVGYWSNRSDTGQTRVGYWSNAGRILVKRGSDIGQTRVGYWSNAPDTGQTRVGYWSNAGRTLVKRGSDTGQTRFGYCQLRFGWTLVKCASDTGQTQAKPGLWARAASRGNLRRHAPPCKTAGARSCAGSVRRHSKLVK